MWNITYYLWVFSHFIIIIFLTVGSVILLVSLFFGFYLHEWIAGLNVPTKSHDQSIFSPLFLLYTLCMCVLWVILLWIFDDWMNSLSFVACHILTLEYVFFFWFVSSVKHIGKKCGKNVVSSKLIPFERWTKNYTTYFVCNYEENKSFMSWMRATFFRTTKKLCLLNGMVEIYKQQQHTAISIAPSVMLRLIVFDVRSPNEITIGSNLLSHHICFDGYRILMCVNLDFAIKMCYGFGWAEHTGLWRKKWFMWLAMFCLKTSFYYYILFWSFFVVVVACTLALHTNYCLIRPIFNDHCMGASLAKPFPICVNETNDSQWSIFFLKKKHI